MKREEYLNRLRLSLQSDGFDQVEEAIAYFNDLLEDHMAEEGLEEEQAVSALEPPETAARLLAEGFHQERAGNKEAQPDINAPPGGSGAAPGMRSYSVKADTVRQIQIHDRHMRVEVIGEERADIALSHPEDEKHRYNFTLEGGVMRLERLSTPWSVSFLFFSWPDRQQVTLRLPREIAAGMELRTSNGRISVRGLSLWGSLTAQTSNAKMVIEETEARDARLESSNGQITLSRVTTREGALVARTSNAVLTAHRLLAGAISLTTSNGSLELDDLKAAETLTAKTSNARLTAQNCRAPGGIQLASSNGRVQLESLDSPRIDLRTSNAPIRGTLPGAQNEYAITSGTSNGKNSLPRQAQGGPRVLSAHTSNADISLGFQQNSAARQPSSGGQEDDPADKPAEDAAPRPQQPDESTGQDGKDDGSAIGSFVDRIANRSQQLSEAIGRRSEQFSENITRRAEQLRETIAQRVEQGVSNVLERLDGTLYPRS